MRVVINMIILGNVDDVGRRKQLANVAFRNLWTVRFRRYQIGLKLRLCIDLCWFDTRAHGG